MFEFRLRILDVRERETGLVLGDDRPNRRRFE